MSNVIEFPIKSRANTDTKKEFNLKFLSGRSKGEFEALYCVNMAYEFLKKFNDEEPAQRILEKVINETLLDDFPLEVAEPKFRLKYTPIEDE